jgi:rod shape-determining protein MreC
LRVIISLIQKFFNLILFVGIEIVCMLMIAKTNTLQGNDLMNSANLGIAFWYKKQTGVSTYFGLRQMNDSLLNENTRLRQQLAKYSEIDILNNNAVTRSYTLNDSVHSVQYAHYTYYQARVVNNSVNSASNFITINRGYKDGIEKNMAVISSNGIAGRITNVSAHFATALSILNNKQSLSAKLKNGTSSFVYWEEGASPDELFMKGIPPDIVVKLGDTVFTTSYSTLFPADMIVGTVQKIFKLKKDNSQILHLKPATNFRNMQYVYVIKNDYMEERRKLEDTTKKQLQTVHPPK